MGLNGRDRVGARALLKELWGGDFGALFTMGGALCSQTTRRLTWCSPGEATPEHGMSISLRGYRDCTRHHTVLRSPPCLVCRAAAGLAARSPRREGWCMLCRDPSEKNTLDLKEVAWTSFLPAAGAAATSQPYSQNHCTH